MYLQKPLTHHIHETRILGAEAVKAGVTTQMGTQGHSSIETSLAVDLIKSGAIGKVKEVICWENKKATWWPKVTERKALADPVPEHIDWNLWLGVANEVPFLDGAYHPSMWRSWVDFGVGMMGDMGCHLLDGPFWACGLGEPYKMEAECNELTDVSWPKSSHVVFYFKTAKYGEIKLHWYEGSLKPERPAELEADRDWDKIKGGKFETVTFR